MELSIEEVRNALGPAYASKPEDNVISRFIERRSRELEELIKRPLEEETSEHLKKWLLNKVCADVLSWDLVGVESAETIDYTIDALRESRSENVRLKLEWIKTLEERAELAIRMYFLKLVGYRGAKL